MSTIGERLQLVAKLEGLNMKDVSEKTGISYRSIQSYFSGKQLPGAEALGKLRAAYGFDLNWLITGDGTTLSNKDDVDYLLLYEATLFVRRSFSEEFENVPVEFFLDTILHFYNSALKCRTEKERDLVWAAQIKMVSAWQIRDHYEKLICILPPEQQRLPNSALLLQDKMDSLSDELPENVDDEEPDI